MSEAPGSGTPAEALATEVADWWRTGIIEMEPGVIRLRGYPIESLIGEVGLASMVWLMTRGELPGARQAALLEAVPLDVRRAAATRTTMSTQVAAHPFSPPPPVV